MGGGAGKGHRESEGVEKMSDLADAAEAALDPVELLKALDDRVVLHAELDADRDRG